MSYNALDQGQELRVFMYFKDESDEKSSEITKPPKSIWGKANQDSWRKY